jgi:hypothetical protein
MVGDIVRALLRAFLGQMDRARASPRRFFRGVGGGSQRVVHRVREPAAHALDYVGVGVQRDAYAGMAQQLLDVLGVLACHKQNRGAGVPEVVQPDGWELRTLEQRLEVPPQQIRPAWVVPVTVGNTRPPSSQTDPSRSFFSAWRARWLLRASTAFLENFMDRPVPDFGSSNLWPVLVSDSVRLTCSVGAVASRSRSSHRSPSISPLRSPAWSAST